MKNRIRFAITLAGVVLWALPNVAMAQSGSGNSQGDQGAAIEGTWYFTVEVKPGVTFWALQSFTAGGVTVATGTGDRTLFGPVAISPLYGGWSSKDDGTYVATIYFFTFNPDGTPAGLFKTNETFRVIGNTLEGNGVGFSCNYESNTGDNCTSMGGPPIKITGNRIIAQGASN